MHACWVSIGQKLSLLTWIGQVLFAIDTTLVKIDSRLLAWQGEILILHTICNIFVNWNILTGIFAWPCCALQSFIDVNISGANKHTLGPGRPKVIPRGAKVSEMLFASLVNIHTFVRVCVLHELPWHVCKYRLWWCSSCTSLKGVRELRGVSNRTRC